MQKFIEEDKQDKESASELRHSEFKQLEAKVMERFELESAVSGALSSATQRFREEVVQHN